MTKACINSPAPGERYLNPAGSSPSPLPRLRSDSWHKKQRSIEDTSSISDNVVPYPSENNECDECCAKILQSPNAPPSRSHPTYAVESGALSMLLKCEQPDIVVQAENWDVSRELGLTISRMSSDSGCISATSYSVVATPENPANLVPSDNSRSSSSNSRDGSHSSSLVSNSLLDQPRPSYSSRKHSIISHEPYQFPPSQYLDIGLVDSFQQDDQLWRGNEKQSSDSSTENDDSCNNWYSDSNDLADIDDVGRFEGVCRSGADHRKSSSKSTGTAGWITATSSVNSRSTSDTTEALWSHRSTLHAKRATHSSFSSPTHRVCSAGRDGPATEGCLPTPFYGTSTHTRRSSSRMSTSDSLHLKLEAAQSKIERLSLSLRTAEGRHEEKAQALLRQLSALQSESDELAMENEALAAALLQGVKDTALSPTSPSSSLPSSSHSLSPTLAAWKDSATDKRDADRMLDDEYRQWVMDRASVSSTADRIEGRARTKTRTSGTAVDAAREPLCVPRNLLLSRSTDPSSALDVLLELRRIGEEAALHLRSKCDLEKRFKMSESSDRAQSESESGSSPILKRSWSRDQATQVSRGAEGTAEPLLSRGFEAFLSQPSEVTRLLAEIEFLSRAQATHLLDRAQWEKRAAQQVETDRQRSAAAEEETARQHALQMEEVSIAHSKVIAAMALDAATTAARTAASNQAHEVEMEHMKEAIRMQESRTLVAEQERSNAESAIRTREAAFNTEKEGLLATIQYEVEAAARERAAHTTTLSNRDAAAAVERALLVQQHRETEESFAVQRETLNGHIAALKVAGADERDAMVSLMSSLRLSASKEKDMMELLQVTENAHNIEHDSMVSCLSVSAAEITAANAERDRLYSERSEAMKERELLVDEIFKLKARENTLMTMLDDLKATSSLEKDAIVQERNLFEAQVRQLQSDKDNIAVNMFELEERLQEVIVDRQVITKEKSSLLSRILFLGEQRSSLMREAEERDKRDVEQVATIAGLNEEWASLQTELSAAEAEMVATQLQLASALRDKEEAVASCEIKMCAMKGDLECYMRESDSLQSQQELILSSLKGEMQLLEERYRVKEASYLTQLHTLKRERDADRAEIQAAVGTARLAVPSKSRGSVSDVSEVLSAASAKLALLPTHVNVSPVAPKQTLRIASHLSLRDDDSQADTASECGTYSITDISPRLSAYRDSETSDVSCGTYSESAYLRESDKSLDLESTMREIEKRQRSFGAHLQKTKMLN